MRRLRILAMVLAASLAVPAFAKDRPPERGPLDAAKLLAQKGDAAGAAAEFGAVLASAQAAGDLALEDQAAEAFAALVDAAPADPVASSKETRSGTSRAALLMIVLRKLDKSRSGAFVAAPSLARHVLQSATRTGDTTLVAEAAAVVRAHASRPGSGVAAPVVAKFAEGMKAAAEGKFDAATAPLEAAAGAAAKAGWWDLATCAATEAAAAWTKLGSAEQAVAIVQSTADALGPACDPRLVARWKGVIDGRVPGGAASAPAAVCSEKLAKASYAGNEAGPGAPGADAGSPGTALALALPKLAKSKPFVSATWTAAGFDVRCVAAPDARPKAPVTQGVRYVVEGCVTLGFRGRAVALCAVDLHGGRNGARGRDSHSPASAVYLVAEGETWSVSKEGVVTLSK